MKKYDEGFIDGSLKMGDAIIKDLKDKIVIEKKDLIWLLEMSKIARHYMGRPIDEWREKEIKKKYLKKI